MYGSPFWFHGKGIDNFSAFSFIGMKDEYYIKEGLKLLKILFTGEKCLLCHYDGNNVSRGTELHHNISRRRKAFIINPLNIVPLCPEHHRGTKLSAHSTPGKYLQILRIMCPEKYEFYIKNKNRIIKHNEFSLKEQFERLRDSLQ